MMGNVILLTPSGYLVASHISLELLTQVRRKWFFFFYNALFSVEHTISWEVKLAPCREFSKNLCNFFQPLLKDNYVFSTLIFLFSKEVWQLKYFYVQSTCSLWNIFNRVLHSVYVLIPVLDKFYTYPTSLQSRLLGKISIIIYIHMTPPLWQKVKNWRASWWKWKS